MADLKGTKTEANLQAAFAAQFMEELIENSTELQMVYELLQNCKEN